LRNLIKAARIEKKGRRKIGSNQAGGLDVHGNDVLKYGDGDGDGSADEMFVGTAMMPDECRVALGSFLNICGEKASRRGSERSPWQRAPPRNSNGV
jgi:hypothetical protein